MILRWLLSSTLRQAAELRRHVLKVVNFQRDLLPEQATQAILESVAALDEGIRSGADKKILQQRMADLEVTANHYLKRYPHAMVRENLEVLLIALAVAIGIRCFFLQPMKIPSGSMQPTLSGVVCENFKDQAAAEFPRGLERWIDFIFRGISYYHLVARQEGEFQLLDKEPRGILPFVTRQRFAIGEEIYSVWFLPDEFFFAQSGLSPGQHFRKGEDILKCRVTRGDHLFVNRVTYNFRPPRRGEIIIFGTQGVKDLPQDTFYIKRLVALGGERVRIGNDQHVIINGRRLNAATPHFENIYFFPTNYHEDNYFGHANQLIGERIFPQYSIAPLFKDETVEHVVGQNHYFVLGDNTLNSSDSRFWGDLPKENVIGKLGFVYWPISSRFGWGHR